MPEPDRDGDLALAVGERGELLARVAPAVVAVAVGDVADQPAGDRRRQHRLAGGDAADGADDLGRRRVLEQEPAGAGAQGAQHVVVGLEGREDDHLGRPGAARAAARSRSSPSMPGMRMSISTTSGWCSGHRAGDLAAVGGLADDRDVVGAREQHRQPGADERVVVDDQDADPVAHRGHGSQARSRKSPLVVEPVLEAAAGERGALGQADEAGAGARDRRSRPPPARAPGCAPRS